MTFFEAALSIAAINDPTEARAAGCELFGKRYMRVLELMAMDVDDVRVWLKRMDEDGGGWL